MPPIDVDLWRQVNLDERVWASFHAQHKMGWLHPGDIVHLVEKYKENWYRIDPDDSEIVDLKPPHNLDGSVEPKPDGTFDYSTYWVKDNDLGLFGPVPEPEPEPSLLEKIIVALARLAEKILSLFGY